MSTTPDPTLIDAATLITEEDIIKAFGPDALKKKNRITTFVKNHAGVIAIGAVLLGAVAYSVKRYDPSVYNDMPDFHDE